jgi:hypothetical protein
MYHPHVLRASPQLLKAQLHDFDFGPLSGGMREGGQFLGGLAVNYNEPAFDKDYLGQSASGDYLKSIENKMKTDASLAKVTTVSEPPPTISATTSFDPYDELSALEESLQDVRRNIVSLNEAKIDYQKQMRVINRNLGKLGHFRIFEGVLGGLVLGGFEAASESPQN